MFKSIVVAFDGSMHAGRALEIGAGIAAQEQVPLGIIYVIDPGHFQIPAEMRKMREVEPIVEPMPRMMIDFQVAPVDLLNTMHQTSADSEKIMLRYAEFLVGQARGSALDCGVKDVDSRVMLGSPAEEVVDFASDRNADLIVCGSRGFGRLKSLLLGSTSHKIAQLAECSCMTVK